MSKKGSFLYKLEASTVLAVIGIIFLFSFAVIITLEAPRFIDPSWTNPTSVYQVQMYEVSDPNFYVGKFGSKNKEQVFVRHLKQGYTLINIQESKEVKIVAPEYLKPFITKKGDKKIKLTSKLLLLRKPKEGRLNRGFDAYKESQLLRKKLQKQWEEENPNWKEEGKQKVDYTILELYEHPEKEAFSIENSDMIFENWVDKGEYIILDDQFPKQPYHKDPGVIYVLNPMEYRYLTYRFGKETRWKYDPQGKPVKNLKELKGDLLGFRSKKELISVGEDIFKYEGCWYCHTDQTRTLISDVVLNGSESYPAPPSSASEYIYQKVTFMGTRRIGPDISRVGIKRPSRDWHMSHFWEPRTESPGSIMPSFRHFFDFDPRGVSLTKVGVPNYRFEAVYQYLMTKGTRIDSPSKAWWKGKGPIKTKEIIEGRIK